MGANYQKLIVWQKAIDLVSEIYRLTEEFPKKEIYGITSQIRRSAISIPSNIAEGAERRSKKDFSRFLEIAISSNSELETQLLISEKVNLVKNINLLKKVLLGSAEIRKMLHSLRRSQQMG